MSKAIYKSTNDIRFFSAVYPDPRRTIKQYKSILEQGFEVINIDALQNVQNHKSNNFSFNYITRPGLLTEFTELSTLTTTERTITTKIEFFKDEDVDSQFVYIFASPSLSGSLSGSAVQSQRGVDIQKESVITYSNNFYFELDILDSYFLRVRHNDGLFDFFLNWDEAANQLGFIKTADEAITDLTSERSDMFRYNVDDLGRLHLFKRNSLDSSIYVFSVSGDETDGYDPVMVNVDSLSGIQALSSNTAFIRYKPTFSEQYQNFDFISYKTSQINNLSINSDKSLYDQEGQYLFHSEYNTIDVNSDSFTLNFMMLDINRSEYSFIKRGANMFNATEETPTFKYRTYNTLDTGVDEERGHDKLSLTYTYYDKDIYIENGTTTIFRAPSSIYPFEQLNVNDTTFVKNGAFSGPTPLLADRVFVRQDQRDRTYKNGRYLCTWLSAGAADTPGVWVDRYYYPDVIEKEAAYANIPKYQSMLDDHVDTLYTSASAKQNISNTGYFDKRSDLVITPNCSLKYERIGKEDIESVVASSSPIASGFDNCVTSRILRQVGSIDNLGEVTETLCKTKTTDSFKFDGTFFTKLSVYEAINNTKSFTISFDGYIDPTKQYGLQLLGNSTNRGFGLFQDLTVTPFLHVAGDNILYLYNTDGILLNRVEFDDNIAGVYRRSVLRDFIVVCTDGSIYRVDAKGNALKLDTDTVSGFINTHMEDDEIYFLLRGDIVKRLDLSDLTLTDVASGDWQVQDFYNGVNEGEGVEFDGSNVIWYENIVKYNDTVYLFPGCDLVWETDDIVFYTLKYEDNGVDYWGIIKHDLRAQPKKIFCSTSAIGSKAIVLGDTDNFIYFSIGNKVYQYTTQGVLVDVIDYDEAAEGAEVEEVASLSGGEILGLDVINEYVDGGINNNRLITIQTTSDGQVVLDGSLIVPGVSASNYAYIPITNYNALNRMYDSTSLDFRLTLKNNFNTEDVRTDTINYNINQIDTGWHSFCFTFDSVKGEALLYVDGLLYESVSLTPGKYKIHDIFNDELYVGTAGFYNGLDLSTYLKQPGYYYVNNFSIRNFFVYDEAISQNLVYALNLLDSRLDKLVLSIPHGQRNNKATIERFYKFGRHNSSNAIDIVVNNFAIDDGDIQEQIRLNILNEAEDILPVGVVVNSIRFEE